MGLILAKTVIGMDIGKKYSWCEAVSTETGDVLKERRLTNRKEDFISFVETLPKPVRLVMEATGNSGYLYECWEDLVEEIQLAHPLKTKAIASAKIKTDRIDDGILAHLGMADLVPQAYFPPREVRDLREILRHRAFMVSLQTRVKNRIHSYLWKLGIETEDTDLFGKSGFSWLKGLETREPYRALLDQDLKILEALQQEIKHATQTIDRLAKEDPRAQLILPIKGIGKYSAMLILAEIGEIDRFPEPKKLVSFSGLCPSTFQSGKVSYHGKITKQGSKWLRWILVEAAQKYARAPGRLGNLFRRIEKKKGRKTAKVAVAREILVCIYHCLKKGVAFEETPKRVKRVESQHAPLVSGCSDTP
jgi:transposase